MTPTTIYLVVYDWVDGTTIHDAFTTFDAAQTYIEDVLKDTRRCQVHKIRLWGEDLGKLNILKRIEKLEEHNSSFPCIEPSIIADGFAQEYVNKHIIGDILDLLIKSGEGPVADGAKEIKNRLDK